MHPGDEQLFAPAVRPLLARAVHELSWLLSRDYNATSALKLVGDRYALTRRQRMAVSRCACASEALQQRRRREQSLTAMRGVEVALDGFNCIITLETALSGGVVLVGLDGCCRDLSSIHGTYRAVSETPRAIELLGAELAAHQVAHVHWLLDQPVSNSRRIKALLAELAREHGWPWSMELVYNPDRELAAATAVVVSSDSWVIDRCSRWVNLLSPIIEQHAPEAWLLDLSSG